MLPPGAGPRGPAGRAVHLRLGGLPWGTVPGPPGPAMARPQRTPARSPDSIVEVKSKVRVSLASALATALGAPNSLFLSYWLPGLHHLLLSSILHVLLCVLSASLHPTLPPTTDLQSPSVVLGIWRARKRPWTMSLVWELRFRLKAAAVAAAFHSPGSFRPAVRGAWVYADTLLPAPSASSSTPSSDALHCLALQ